jgi:AraC-like DNA-binding protein
MTASDNRLTKDAKVAGEARSPGAAWSFPVGDLRVFLAGLEQLGHKPAALLAALEDDPDRRISCEAFGALFGAAQRKRPIRNLPMRLAEKTPIGAYPLLDYLIITSNTVGDGMRRFARYFRLIETPITIEIRDEQQPIQMMVSAVNNPFAVEYTTALTVLNLRRETDDRLRAECVAFVHRPDDVAEMELLLGCPVRSEQAWSGLALSGETWRLAFRRRDPVLRELLERQANEIVERLPSGGGPILQDVRRALARRVAGGDTRIDEVARELATTARTLQRRLAASGASYQDLVESIRREAAEKYLLNSSLSIAEVAYLLGYSEPSALHRAFKRWKNETQDEFRKSARRR